MADKFRYSFDLTKKLEEQLQQSMLASGQEAVTSSPGMMSADPPAKELQEAEQSKYDPYSFIKDYKDMLFSMFGGEEEYSKVVAQQDTRLPIEEDPLNKVTEPYLKIIDVPQQPPVQVEQLEPDTESTQQAISKATEQTLGIMQIEEYLDSIKQEKAQQEPDQRGLMAKPYDADRMREENEPLTDFKIPEYKEYSSPDEMSDLEILARTIEAEARGEPFEGKIAVGAVIANRAASGSYGNNIKGVILRKGQFSPWNKYTGHAGGRQGKDMMKYRASRDSYKAANAILTGMYEDPTNGSTHYVNESVAEGQSWIQTMKNRKRGTVTIGNHLFGNADSNKKYDGKKYIENRINVSLRPKARSEEEELEVASN
jgi:spore germination cell wall hydrolase CwlJ-like protein